jgi:hypothetical protein
MHMSSLFRISRLAACSALLAAACTGDAVAPFEDSPAFVRAADPPQVPFRLTVLSGTQVVAPDGRCGPFPMLTVDVEGIAVSTHLGRTTFRQSHCINAFDPDLAFTDGEFTDTGADGSSIHGTYSGVLVPTATPPVVEIQGVFVITGGTRRFAGATGGGRASGTLGLVLGDFTLALDGTVSSPGSR